MYVFVTRP